MATKETQMESSWLVQRLEKPRKSGLFGADNPFAFGGGLKNGGLSDEGMGLIREIFAFDYMGSAEFEFGAVPKALNRIAVQALEGGLRAFSFTVPLADVPKQWHDKSKKVPTGEATIYVLCPQEFAVEVEDRVRKWASEEYPRLKEALHLNRTLRPVEEWDGDTCGWLELDNGFFFFTDKTMWQNTCGLFEVAVPEESK
jgi:hypothetical protein